MTMRVMVQAQEVLSWQAGTAAAWSRTSLPGKLSSPILQLPQRASNMPQQQLPYTMRVKALADQLAGKTAS